MSVSLEYLVPEKPERWLLEEEDVPETPLHDATIALLKLILDHWVARRGASALVARNLGCRWEPQDARIGADPDIVWIEPGPPEGLLTPTLRVWEPDHNPPRLAIEVVSEGSGDKDYLDAPARCARLGVSELWVFDPMLYGPAGTGGPFPLQIWRRRGKEPAAMVRIYAGPARAYSPELDAYLVTVGDGRYLRIADDEAGDRLWPTESESVAARAEAESARAAAESARAEAESARAKAESARAEDLAAEVARLRAILKEE